MNGHRHDAVYNRPIEEMPFPLSGFATCRLAVLFVVLLTLMQQSAALDWSRSEQELSRKIVAATGPGAVALEMVNRSSLSKQETDEIGRELRAQLESLGARTVKLEQAAATVTVTLSENPQSYVWVAEIRQGANDFLVVMVSLPRSDAPGSVGEVPPLTIRKTPLWTQPQPILDVAVMDDSATPSHIAVLDPEKIAFYR